MQKRFQQLTDIALDTLGLSRIEDAQLIDHLKVLDQMEKDLRDLEKACSDMYSYFEQARESASSMVSWTNDLVAASGQEPAIRKINLRFRNLNQVNESTINDQIQVRLEENIFSKMEVRREVLASLRKRVEECSLIRARYNIVHNNYLSIENDEEAKSEMSADEILSIQTECDRLRIRMEEGSMQIASDMDNYAESSTQFLLESYHYVCIDYFLGNLLSLVNSSMHTALVSGLEESSQLTPSANAKKETRQMDLKAGLSTIQSIEVKKGEKIWWEIAASGDVGFGVLFKHETEAQEKVLQTLQQVKRVDPATEDTRGFLMCEKDGLLEFGFDNSFSYFRSKGIELYIYKE